MDFSYFAKSCYLLVIDLYNHGQINVTARKIKKFHLKKHSLISNVESEKSLVSAEKEAFVTVSYITSNQVPRSLNLYR